MSVRVAVLPVRRAALYSLIFHVVLFSVFLVTRIEQEVPAERDVFMVITESRLERELIDTESKPAAPGDREREMQADFRRQARPDVADPRREKSLLVRERPVDDAAARIRSADQIIPLSRNEPSPLGREAPVRPQDFQRFSGRESLEKDTRTREGSAFTPGADDLSRSAVGREPGPDPGVRPMREGAAGLGVTGNVNLKGRGVIHRPEITLPERYSRMGRTFTVSVEFVVAPEGLVVQARVAQSVGDLELERILVQYARRYRFEPVKDAGNQAGTITFTIVPR